jgi:hypothetical protein
MMFLSLFPGISLALFSTPLHAFAPQSNARVHAHALKHNMVSSAREAIDWLKKEELDSLLPKEDSLTILNELLSDGELIDDSERLIIKNWDKLEHKLMEEKRSVAEIIGKETTDRVLKSVENVDGYDPQAVRAFLGSEAVNKLLAQVLYDGIYNFFQTIDVFGNIIGNLPIIGPMRNRIRDDAKKNLDRTVGPLIKTFLTSYTKTAVLEASNFVLSPANRNIFGSANANLVSNVLERPVNTLIPSSELTAKLRDDTFEYLRSVDSKDLEEYVTFCYDIVGDKSLDDALDVNRIIDASPTLQKVINKVWSGAINGDSDQ